MLPKNLTAYRHSCSLKMFLVFRDTRLLQEHWTWNINTLDHSFLNVDFEPGQNLRLTYHKFMRTQVETSTQCEKVNAVSALLSCSMVEASRSVLKIFITWFSSRAIVSAYLWFAAHMGGYCPVLPIQTRTHHHCPAAVFHCIQLHCRRLAPSCRMWLAVGPGASSTAGTFLPTVSAVSEEIKGNLW